MDGNNGEGRGRGGRGRSVKLQEAGRRPGNGRQDQRTGPPMAWTGGGVRGPSAPQQQQRHQAGLRQSAPSTSGAGPRPSAPSVVLGEGRATVHRVEQPTSSRATVAEGAAARAGAGDNTRGAMRGKRVINEIVKTRQTDLQTKRGVTGKEVTLQANYFRITKKPNWTLNQYRVDFSPDIELLGFRKALLAQHRNVFDGYLFDGTVLFTPKKLQTEPSLELVSTSRDGELYKITIKFVGVIEMFDYQYLQVLNLILRRAMEGLQLQLVGRNFFDPHVKIDIREHHLELWPGYKTSIRQHEQDILLCSEVVHKVMRTDTIHNILQSCINESRNYQDTFIKEVIGMVVLTDYNNKTYRVDEVDFKSTPKSKFSTKNGDISYIDYYKKRYNLSIRDPNQPLLVSRSTERNLRAGQPEFIMLVPELCRATGINDNMKSNFRLMNAMSEHTRLAPRSRIERLRMFNRRLQQTAESVQILQSWQFTLDQDLVEMSGRILREEEIIFGDDKRVTAGKEADWNRSFRDSAMYSIVHLTKWVVIVPARNRRETADFVKCLINAARGMKMNIREPQFNMINDDRNNSYVSAIDMSAKLDPQLIFAVVPNNNAERYSCIKKKLCVDRAIPSQVVMAKTITPKKGKGLGSIMSVATKVAIQMNCKIMGAPWNIELKVNGLMTVGFDVCHSSRDASKSYGALVATMDLRRSTRFFSTVIEHNKGQELSDKISFNMSKALKEYRELHGTLPEKILFYRDGVGEGQLHQVIDTEVVGLLKRVNDIYEHAGFKKGCALAFIVVSKQINTRYFYNQNNPPPGTVVDDVITLPERYDFFLVSQSVRQGTVSPTNYNVIHDNLGLDPDKIQRLTYKFTHLYYNWSGTTRVPAMCQYAHKLAYLVGQSIHQAPSQLFEKQLFYL